MLFALPADAQGITEGIALKILIMPGKVDLQFIVTTFLKACGWEVIFRFSLLGLVLFM